MSLIIDDLRVSADPSTSSGRGKKEILKGIDLEVGSGQLHVLMGPNGSGKSTLAQVLMGSSQFTVHSSRLRFNGQDLKELTPDKRAKLGIFLAFQHPVEVPGVSVFNVLRKVLGSVGSQTGNLVAAKKRSTKLFADYDSSTRLAQASASNNGEGLTKSKRGAGSVKFLSDSKISYQSASEFRQQLLEYASSLKLSDDFLRRSLNEGFSGGEKKRSEILQLMALKPKLAILDEIDSGLDVDGLKLVAGAIKQFTVHSPQSSVLLITHYARVLKYLKPDFVHVMVEGRIVKSGSMKLAKQIEEEGYQSLTLSS